MSGYWYCWGFVPASSSHFQTHSVWSDSPPHPPPPWLPSAFTCLPNVYHPVWMPSRPLTQCVSTWIHLQIMAPPSTILFKKIIIVVGILLVCLFMAVLGLCCGKVFIAVCWLSLVAVSGGYSLLWLLLLL